MGLKNGINAFGKKNFIGVFAPPFAVVNDFDLLATLPDRDKRAGYAEAVKVALIRDRHFFESLEGDAERLAQFEPGGDANGSSTAGAELHVEHMAGGGDPFGVWLRAPAGLRTLGRAQAGAVVRLSIAPRRGGGHRHGCGRDLFAQHQQYG